MHETPFPELSDLLNVMFEGTGLAVATIGAMGSSVVTGMMLARLVGDPIIPMLMISKMLARLVIR